MIDTNQIADSRSDLRASPVVQILAHQRAMQRIARGDLRARLNHVQEGDDHPKSGPPHQWDPEIPETKEFASYRTLAEIAARRDSPLHGLNHVVPKESKVINPKREFAIHGIMDEIAARRDSPLHGLNHVVTKSRGDPGNDVGDSDASFEEQSAHSRAMLLIAGLDKAEFLKPGFQTRVSTAPVVIAEAAEQKRGSSVGDLKKHDFFTTPSKELLLSIKAEAARLQLNHVRPRVTYNPVVGVSNRLKCSIPDDDNNNAYRKVGRGWVLM